MKNLKCKQTIPAVLVASLAFAVDDSVKLDADEKLNGE